MQCELRCNPRKSVADSRVLRACAISSLSPPDRVACRGHESPGDPRQQERKELALQGALETLAPGPWVERADTPDGVVTAVRRLPAGRREVRAVSRAPRSAAAGRARAARHRSSSTAIRPRRSRTSPPAATSSSRRRRRRARRSATTCRSWTRSCAIRPRARCICSRRRRWRRIRWPSCTSSSASSGEAGGGADRRAHLRRRHAGRCAPDDPHARACRAQQSRHAARRDPAAPSALGEAVREPALHRHRRAARLPRRVRQPPVQRAAAAAADRAALRIGSAVHLLVGDDRQSAGARRAAGRAAVRAGVGQRRAARRKVLRLRQPAGRQPRARHPPFVSRRNAPRGGRVPAPPAAGDRLCAEPADDRDSDDVSQRGFRGRARHAGADSRLSRRLSAAAPPRDRARACAKAWCAAWSRPTRSSSASTSARSTSRCWPAIPGTIAATWQRAGRAGRRTARSAAVLVGSSAPIDQFVVRHPSYFFDASPEHALVNPDNLHILVDHVKCAAFELPFTTSDAFGARRRAGSARRAAGVGPRAPLGHVGATTDAAGSGTGPASRIRPMPSACARSRPTTSSSSIRRAARRSSAETDFTSGPPTLHPKAIYIVEGRLFQVEKLDFDGRKAYVREVDCDYYTDAITHTRVTILDRVRRRCAGRRASRRSARRVARRRLQEDQVLHERECRLGRARPARAADAHDGVLARDAARRAGGAAVCDRRSARRHLRPGVCDEADRRRCC